MTQHNIVMGVLLDESPLTLEELARACTVEPKWIIERVEAGYLGGHFIQTSTTWEFTSADLQRARRLAELERNFGANQELAALVVDLMDEIKALRTRLKAHA